MINSRWSVNEGFISHLISHLSAYVMSFPTKNRVETKTGCSETNNVGKETFVSLLHSAVPFAWPSHCAPLQPLLSHFTMPGFHPVCVFLSGFLLELINHTAFFFFYPRLCCLFLSLHLETFTAINWAVAVAVSLFCSFLVSGKRTALGSGQVKFKIAAYMPLFIPASQAGISEISHPGSGPCPRADRDGWRVFDSEGTRWCNPTIPGTLVEMPL